MVFMSERRHYTKPYPEAFRRDAVALAELALAAREGDRSGGERYQVVVHVEAQALAGKAAGRCELAEGQPLAAETARRLSCDASLVEVAELDGRLALGRKRRTVSPPLR